MIPNIKMTYNGKNPEDFGVCVTAVTTRKPARKYYSFDIPGRNGVHKEMLRVWDNTTVDVSFAILGESSGDVIDKCDTLMEWLTEPNGYARLELSTDPDVYRMATVSEDFEISDVLAKTGEATVSFDCKPQRYLKAGERPLPQISSASAPGITEIESGYWSQVFSSDFITTSGIDAYPDRIITVIDTTSFAGTGKSLILHYSDERAEESLVGYDTGVLVGRSNIDPTLSGIPSSYDYLHYELYNNDLKIGLTSDWTYTFFETPTYYDIVDSNDDVVASVFPTKVTIYNPTGFSAKPLIRFHYTTQASLWRQPICIVNGSLITLTLSNVQSVSGHLVYVTDYYLDCETSDAYVDLPGYTRAMNVNKDLYLPQEITLNPGENTIMLNNSVDYIEITPRWWRL